MPKQKYDLNDNGKIDPDERQIMLEDRRRMMEDADAKRDAQLTHDMVCSVRNGFIRLL